MDKKKLKSEDGNEFTVYYLKNKEKEEKQIAPVGWLGTNEIKSYFDSDSFALQYSTPSTQPHPAAGGTFVDGHGDAYNISIDDTIESDLVKDPVRGRIYKVRSLNGVVARLKETHVGDENLNPDTIYARMDLHGTEFLVAAEDLLKATNLEVEKYLEKSVD